MKTLIAVIVSALIAMSAVIYAAEEKKPTVTKLAAEDETVVALQALYKTPFEVYKVETEKAVAVYLPVKADEVGDIQLWTKDGMTKLAFKTFEDGVAVMTESGYLVVFSKQPRELGVIEPPKSKEEPKPTETTKPTETKVQKDKVPNTGAHK